MAVIKCCFIFWRKYGSHWKEDELKAEYSNMNIRIKTFIAHTIPSTYSSDELVATIDSMEINIDLVIVTALAFSSVPLSNTFVSILLCFYAKQSLLCKLSFCLLATKEVRHTRRRQTRKRIVATPSSQKSDLMAVVCESVAAIEIYW